MLPAAWLPAIPEGVQERVVAQTQQPPGDRGRSEGAAGAGGVEAPPVVLRRFQGPAETDDHVVARHHCGYEVFA